MVSVLLEVILACPPQHEAALLLNGSPVALPRAVDALVQRILRAGQWFEQDETLALTSLVVRKYRNTRQQPIIEDYSHTI